MTDKELLQERIKKVEEHIFIINMQDYLGDGDYRVLDELYAELKELKKCEQSMN